MKLAVPALVVLASLLPGIFFRYWYARGSWKAPLGRASLSDKLASGFVISVLLHAIWICLAYGVTLFCDCEIDVSLAIALLASSNPGAQAKALAPCAWPIFWYFVTLWAASIPLGYGAHMLVRKLEWEQGLFWFENPWHSLFSGERADVPDDWDSDKGELLIYVKAVTEMGGAPLLYVGEHDEHFFDDDGELDFILLKQAARRLLSEDRPDDAPQQSNLDYRSNKRYHSIDADFFVLPAQDIKNLSVEYFILALEEDAKGAEDLEEIELEDAGEEDSPRAPQPSGEPGTSSPESAESCSQKQQAEELLDSKNIEGEKANEEMTSAD